MFNQSEDAMKPRILLCALLLCVFAPPLFAQWIPIRTVPIIAGNQTDFLPSVARGMGNLSIAFDDPLGDPFINPAKAQRLNGLTLFTSPTRNSWSNEDGTPVSTVRGSSSYPGAALNSVPFGGFLQRDNLFGGVLVSYQGYNAERTQGGSNWIRPTVVGFPEPVTRSDIGNNTYVFGLFGMQFPDANVSVAGSVSWGKYGAMDGVNLLYPGSIDIR